MSNKPLINRDDLRHTGLDLQSFIPTGNSSIPSARMHENASNSCKSNTFLPSTFINETTMFIIFYKEIAVNIKLRSAEADWRIAIPNPRSSA